MKEPTDILSLFVESCIATVVDHNQFWVLAALTDSSYEEGTRNRSFKVGVDCYRDVGVPEILINQLHLGINGNLRNACQKKLPSTYKVDRNPGKGQDLTIFDDKGMALAKIESKLIYDLTLDKYYTSTANDYLKLQKVRSEGFSGLLFLTVFFVQMPNHDYRGCRGYSNDRSNFPGRRGIRNQYQFLRSKLFEQPVWPLNPPHIENIAWPNDFEELKKYYNETFEPTAVWSFESRCLIDAKVGIAIWQCP